MAVPKRAPALTALAVILLDQTVKAAVRGALPVCEAGASCTRLQLVGPIGLLRTENPGGALGLVGAASAIVVLIVGIALLNVQIRLARSWPHTPFAVGLIVGGVVANLLDRVMYGSVTDFLNVAFRGPSSGLVFNPADVAILAGAYVLTARALASRRARV